LQFQVESKPLQDALGLIAGIPGYSDRTVLLTALKTSGELRIECAASGSYIKIELPAKVLEKGSISIDGDYVTSLHLADQAIFQLKGTKMHVSSSKWSYELGVSQVDKVKGNRPSKVIECMNTISTKMLTGALSKSAIVPAIPNPNHGVRLVVAGDEFKVFCNDQFRGTMYKQKLPAEQESFDVVFKLPVLMAITGRIPDQSVMLGVESGMLRVLSGTVEFYYPTLQAPAEDVEGYFDSMDYKQASTMEVDVEGFVNDVRAASSIVSSIGYEAKLDLTFDKANVEVHVSSPHGEAKAEHVLAAPIEDERFNVKLSNKYLQEMLALLGDPKAKLSIWDDLIVFASTDGVYKSVMPTIADEQ